MLERREALVDVARQRVEAMLHLRQIIGDLLDLAGQRAHLVVDLAEAHLGIDRCLRVPRAHRHRRAAGPGAAIDLSLEQIHVALEPVESVEQRADVGARLRLRVGRKSEAKPAQEDGKSRKSHRRQILRPHESA
jgi:hypothetical protein